MKLGFITSQDNDSLPQAQYYSFEDIDGRGHVTFIEVDDKTSARVKTAATTGLGCRPLEGSAGRSLIKCQVENQQVLVYDLDRAFFAGVSQGDGRLLDQVLAVIAK